MQLGKTELSTDILVVGAGSAGAMAAIKAKIAGADVLVVTKGPYPSGNSTKALAGYAAAFGHNDPQDNTDVHFGDVLRNGIGLCNQKMVKTWTNTICELTEEMRGWGLDLIRDEDDEKYIQIPWEGHTYPRMVNHHRVTGKYIMKCLEAKSAELGIETLSHTIVGGLFKDGERVTGAWAVNYRSGELYIIKAKAVIMSTGGYGALYPVGDNVSAATGEGYAVAFDAGAEMIGMEFGHYLTTPLYPEKMQVKFVFVGFVNGLINESVAKLFNGDGERFMLKHFPETGEQKHTAEELCRYIGLEICEGRVGPHGGVLFDVSEVPAEFETSERYARIWELAERAGLDLRKEPIELTTYPHDLVGGIKIDERGQTNVPGLFAAGEATGGSHGASRFGGSALSDCMVFGAIGAGTAARYCREMNESPTLDDAEVKAVEAKLTSWIDRPEGVVPADTMQEIKSLAGHHLNMVRSETGILAAFAEVDRMETEAVSNFSVQGETDKETAANIRRAIEAEGQLKLCRLLGAASLEREESRGGFFGGAYRAEFPAQDDENWLRNVVLKKENGSITARTEVPVEIDEEFSAEIHEIIATAWEAPDDDDHYFETE